MKIAIVGLGLIGGSYAMGLSLKGHKVFGIDKNMDAVSYAKQKGYIEDNNWSTEQILKAADLIILAIYPQAILNFLKEYQLCFQKNQVITDVCGVKSNFIHKATLLANPATYVSHHPMAGKEKIGIEFADCKIFKGANFLITPLEQTPITVI